MAHAGQALGRTWIDLNGSVKGLKRLIKIIKRRIGAPEIAMIGGIFGIYREGALDQFNGIARLVASQANEAEKMQRIGKFWVDFKQQSIKRIRLIQAPDLMMLHRHIQQLSAILFGPDRRLLWLALRLVYPLNVSHWARIAFAILRKG